MAQPLLVDVIGEIATTFITDNALDTGPTSKLTYPFGEGRVFVVRTLRMLSKEVKRHLEPLVWEYLVIHNVAALHAVASTLVNGTAGQKSLGKFVRRIDFSVETAFPLSIVSMVSHE